VSADPRFWKIDSVLTLLTAVLNLSDMATSVGGFYLGLGEQSALLGQILAAYGVLWFVVAKLGVSAFLVLGYVLLRRRWEKMHPVVYLSLMLLLTFYFLGFGYATVHNLILILQRL
jgi:hypothetical protein